MEGQSQASRADLETGRTESAEEIAQAVPAMAQRWLVHLAPPPEEESCLELRFCASKDDRWKAAPYPGHLG